MSEITNEKCRTCLIEAPEMISLAADHVASEKVMSISELIMLCSSVQIKIGDSFPQFVCIECVRSAEKSYSFRLLCEQSENTLKTVLQSKDTTELTNETELSHEVDIRDEDYLEDNDSLESEPTVAVVIENKNDTVEVEREKKLESGQMVYEIITIKDNTTCTICDMQFQTAAELTKHVNIHCSAPLYYKCPKCLTRFISEDLLNKHLARHTSKKTTDKPPQSSVRRKRGYKCALCSNFLPSIPELRQHIKTHEQELKEATERMNQKIPQKVIRTWECPICGMRFNNSNNMKRHIQTHKKTVNKYRCPQCYMVFATSMNLDQHLQKHKENDEKKKQIKAREDPMHNKVMYKCKLCDVEFKNLSTIKEHLVAHGIKARVIFQHLKYKCIECSTEHENIYDYFQHNTIHILKPEPKPEPLPPIRKRIHHCTDCTKVFPSPSALKNHMKTHETQWPKKCRYCEVLIPKRADYMEHLNQSHEDLKTFVCSQCGKRFFKERNLHSHIKIHSGERNYMCDICGFSFHAQNNLVAHRRIHTGVKPYQCTFCPRSFSQYAGLRSHMLNHTGEKKYECNVCQKKFLRISAQKNHMKTHTGAKDYACHLCDKKFGASSTRKKHMLTHTGERNHICDFCGKAFSRRSNLNVHRKIHTGETPHVCEICGKGFIQAHVLRSHRNTHRKQQAAEEEFKLRQALDLDADPLNQSDPPEELTILVDLSN